MEFGLCFSYFFVKYQGSYNDFFLVDMTSYNRLAIQVCRMALKTIPRIFLELMMLSSYIFDFNVTLSKELLDWMVGEELTSSYAVLLMQKQRGLTERN